jgi:oxygen-independent coproporphyrinogen-3 oxidase
MHFPVDLDAEVTMEVNPATVTAESLMQYRASGVNRLSVGVQSFDPGVLRCLGRIHTVDEGESLILSALHAGFDDVGIDLIYGIPDQSAVSWDATLSRSLSLNPSHISAYALSWSQATPLGRDIASGRYPRPDEKIVSDMYLLTHDRLTKGGYEHYEVSNFARPGYRCRHNEAYWTGEPYLGIGPSAHSYIQNRRFWNVPDVRRYINVLSQNRLPVAGQEDLNTGQRTLEQIALGLRRREGIALSRIVGRDCVHSLVDAGLAMVQEGKVSLTANGFLLADEIALRLAS